MREDRVSLSRKFAKENLDTHKYLFVKSVNERLSSIFKDELLETASYLIFFDPDDEIKELFGEDVFNLLQHYRLISKVRFHEDEKKLIDLRDKLLQFVEDLRALFLRLIFYAEAVKDESFSDKELAREALYLYAPIARRLGISKIYSDIEDHSFKILFPHEYDYLWRLVERRRNEFEKKLSIMKERIFSLLEGKFPVLKIEGRVKRLFSIFKKMKTKNVSIDEIFDLLALRVITESIPDCYSILGVVHGKWIPIEGRFRDWISHPKPNGYRAIQTTVLTDEGDKFEIQIRTEEMHMEAEYGIAAHWSYKEGTYSKRSFFWVLRLKEFLENYSYIEDSSEFLSQLKDEFKKDFINVLTPKGDIIKLPEGATPIDFAYAIHTEIGNKIVMAKVNGRLVPLRKKLSSGDIVEVITGARGEPSLDWLKFVKTSKARAKIRDWIRKKRKEVFIEEGKKKLNEFIKKVNHKYEIEIKEEDFEKNIEKIGFKTFEGFLLSLGEGTVKVGMGTIRKFIPYTLIKKRRKKKEKKTELEIIIDGLERLEYELAGCCKPKKGDEIIAYITLSRGIRIHKKDCQNIKGFKISKERIKKAYWR